MRTATCFASARSPRLICHSQLGVIKSLIFHPDCQKRAFSREIDSLRQFLFGRWRGSAVKRSHPTILTALGFRPFPLLQFAGPWNAWCHTFATPCILACLAYVSD